MRLLKNKFLEIIGERDLAFEKVKLSGRSLSPNEAIENPEDIDCPLQKGKERSMQAESLEVRWGQAFTDMPGNFEARLSQIVEMDLTNGY